MFNLQTRAALILVFVSLPTAAQQTGEPPELASACQQCHRDSGAATIPGWPPLTALTEKEIATKLRGYRDNLVPGSRMAEVAHDLSEEDIRLLAAYYGHQ